jgi:TPR repeat protein
LFRAEIAAKKMFLVFGDKGRTVVSMDKPLFRRWFSRSQSPALKTIEAEAGPSDANTQFSLGLKCAQGQGAAPDYVQAAHWYLKAANQNHSSAQFNLGLMYAKGQGMPRDTAQSVIWIKKAAQQGHAGAQYNLGMGLYRASLDPLPEDASECRIEAYKWFQLAVMQRHHGSEMVRDLVILGMTREDVADGNRRVAAFNASKLNGDQGQRLESVLSTR